MRRFSAIVAVMFLVVPTVVWAQGAEVRRFPIEFLAFNPCADEVVLVTGEAMIVSHFVTDARGGSHGLFRMLVDGVALGEASGDAYSYHLVDNSVGNRVAADEETRTFLVMLKRLAPPHDVFVAKITVHVTTNANGQPTAEVFFLSSRCLDQ